jgi:hypothetical protein
MSLSSTHETMKVESIVVSETTKKMLILRIVAGESVIEVAASIYFTRGQNELVVRLNVHYYTETDTRYNN